MDFDGIRRDARSSRDTFYEHLADAIIDHLRHHGSASTDAAQLSKRWRLAGARFASHLLPVRKKRFPEELRAFMQGMTLSLQEYESKHNAFMAEPDTADCDKLEENAYKLLRLASHENTPVNEARAAAFALVKLVAGSDLMLVGSSRVRYFVYRYSLMLESYGLLRENNPFLFLWSKGRPEK